MDPEILAKVKRGDHKAYSDVFENWKQRVFYYFLKLTGDEYAAKELVQETFIKFWKCRESISCALTIDEQLFRKARLIHINWLRKEATQRKYFSKDGLKDVEQQVDDSLLQELKQALERLPPKRKKVFELKHIYGYSYKEIAEYLNISVKTVDNHLLKAVSQLRKSFNIFSQTGIFLILIS